MPLRTPDCDDAGQEHASRDHTANPHREEAVSRWTDEDTSTETGAGRLRAGRGPGGRHRPLADTDGSGRPAGTAASACAPVSRETISTCDRRATRHGEKGVGEESHGHLREHEEDPHALP